MTKLYHDKANKRWIWRLPYLVRKSLRLDKHISYDVEILEMRAEDKIVTIKIVEVKE